MTRRPAPLRIGVLGCAEIARRRMLPAFAACPDTHLTAVASRDPERARATAEPYGARPVHGYQDLLEQDDVDAVYVPLPAALHRTWVEAALRCGKHVLAEKPLTTDDRATARLLRLARDRGLALAENTMFVHHPQHTAVRELVDAGAIGELRSLRAEFSVPRFPAGDIRHQPGLGGGALWDTGVYPVRAALHLLGPQLQAVGAVLTEDPALGVDTHGAALLRTPSGTTAHLSFGLDHGYASVYELCGSRGRLTVDRAFTPPADHPPLLRIETREGRRDIRLDPFDQVAAAVAAFAEAAATGAPPDPATLRQAGLLAAVRALATPSDPTAVPTRRS
ncbi:oxidoreductase [Streptomyces sp. DH-12]|uniref:Gfo/Idh/MocA family protein n=1 Tax=unclassified Streptomyces TaxID=2593676 RepID=UPI000CCE3BEC|nr:Gfo/Idh/MocA family oxidoreductase [Streptomyces sp. DH-12]PNV31023.1 oxidoreductase [Streptomyces sp. DH-12]